jgi:hypothetical protein|tara:strand:- start:263 stop:457 length:195 start_codon:yes stop_codon:yes gene_type:complete
MLILILGGDNMNINKIRHDLKTSGDSHLVSLENILTNDQIVKLFKAFNDTDGTPDAVIDFLEKG